ncbi:MAG: metal-dependent phosphohydrolase [Cyanobacteria bacterium J06592_8]
MPHLCTPTLIKTCIQQLQNSYIDFYGNLKLELMNNISSITYDVLSAIAQTDAPYHDLEHTVLVTLTGLEILRGKHFNEGHVSHQDWCNTILSLLCHDIGYLKGICRADRLEDEYFAIGINRETLHLSPETTDASLTPYHVDRGKLFVAETLSNITNIDLDIPIIQHNIEFTRFPIPSRKEYQDTLSFAGLVRAADLIGQLADPNYLTKMGRLFREFEETGTHQRLGYRNPQDLRGGYPDFFHNIVLPYIRDALNYLRGTAKGREIVRELYRNVEIVEQELATKLQPQFRILNKVAHS